nr:MAG TPA_asm: hypothetical protein [Caudoviricetes sp.]
MFSFNLWFISESHVLPARPIETNYQYTVNYLTYCHSLRFRI